MLDTIDNFWKSSQLNIEEYKAESYILKNNDDLIGKLDDNLLIVNNILGSRFVEGVRERAEK